MDLSKLLRRKEKAQDDNNSLLLADSCNKLGNFYVSKSDLTRALREFQEESSIYKDVGKKMDYGRANRMIGEVLILMENYAEALKHEELFLKISKQENELVEQQRAFATIGRCYLLLGERKSTTLNEGNKSVQDFKNAEKSFLKSLIICKDLSKMVSKWELSDMQARLYLNLGITKEHTEEYDESIKYYETAIKTCKINDLYELQHKCLMAAGLSYSLKKGDTSAALNIFNAAIKISKRIQDKNEKNCESLLAKSDILIKNGDFQSARQVLKKAYRLQTPNKDDCDLIQRNLKIVLTISKCEDELVTTNSFNYVKRKELFEQLGDGSCKLKNYTKAIDFYLKMLEAAQFNGEQDQQLIPIYVSLYQTYIDNKDYSDALMYLWKEFELIKDVPSESCSTLLNIANLMDLAGKDFWDVEQTYQRSLTEARACEDIAMEKAVLLKLVKLNHKNGMASLAEILERDAAAKGINLVESSEETDYSEDLLEMCNEISLELELSSDPESSGNEQNRPANNGTPNGTIASTRKKRTTGITVKKNAKGETRLHEACINGNYQLAKMLIDQGHTINVRDNAGWLPLHEASIHGHRDIMELLLDNGGQSAINDKGGASCDGITPLYDACSNGNISVVQLLLDRGAKATLKTDFNESSLDVLVRWYTEYGHKLDASERAFYNEIHQRLSDQFEKVGIDTTKNTSSASSSANSTNRSNKSSQRSQRMNLRYKTCLTDDSDDEKLPPAKTKSTPSPKNQQIQKAVCSEYKNVMERLKNPNKGDPRYNLEDALVACKRTAHLESKEVEFEEWLEDDVGPMKKKQKFYTEHSTRTSVNKTPIKSPVKILDSPMKSNPSFSRKSSSVLIDSDNGEEDVLDYNMVNNGFVDAFGVLMNNKNDRKKPSKSNKNTTSFQPTRRTSQSSLLEAGFSRFMENEENTRISLSSPIKVNQRNCTSTTQIYTQSCTTEKPLIIKVQVEEEKIIVPVNKEAANELKISWLVEETARRYYCIKGIRPELKLKTSDGATLLTSDPISLILSLTDENLICSEILDWILPPLPTRYLQACSELKCSVDHQINETLDINRASIHMDLSNQNLRGAVVKPIFKALQHQSCLSHLDLSNNFLSDEGLKYLSQTLVTLKQFNALNLSGNMITDKGIEYLCNALVKSPIPTEFNELNLNYNPIRSSSLKSISTLCQTKSLTFLSIKSCEITDVNTLVSLPYLKTLDVSYNNLSEDSFKLLFRKLNPGIVENIFLERCSTAMNLGESVVEFINSGNYTVLKDINLSGLCFSENELLDILRCLERCECLKVLNLSHQKELSFLVLKYILLNMNTNVDTVNLIGCKNLQTIDNIINLQSIDECQKKIPKKVLLSLPKSTELQRNIFVDNITNLWNKVCKYRWKFEINSNVISLIVDDDDSTPNNHP